MAMERSRWSLYLQRRRRCINLPKEGIGVKRAGGDDEVSPIDDTNLSINQAEDVRSRITCMHRQRLGIHSHVQICCVYLSDRPMMTRENRYTAR